MILHSIRLRGFLAHRGISDGRGGWQPTEIELSDAPLWLIHGRNGAGKSSLFDAITFALYKQARGRTLETLIHHESDDALVQLDLELDGAIYRVERTLKRGKRVRSSSVVYRIEDDGLTPVEGSVNSAEDWTREALGLDYKAFCFCVLLRQGETDAFLRAGPTERRDALIRLLDLEAFARLGKAANDEARVARDRAESALERLNRLTPIADDELAEQETQLETAREAEQTAHEAHQVAREVLADARRAAELESGISGVREQIGFDRALLGRADEIEARVARLRQLEKVLPLLRGFESARHAEKSARDAHSAARKRLGDAEYEVETTFQARDAIQKAAEAASHALIEAQNATLSAQHASDEATFEAGQATQVEELELKIKAAERDLEPLQPLLSHAAEIEESARRADEARELVPLLRSLRDAQTAFEHATNSAATAQGALKGLQDKFQSAQSEENTAQAQLQAAEAGVQAVQTRRDALEREIDVLRGIWNKRNEVKDAEECPLCGTDLHSPESHARLEAERQHQRARRDHLKAELERENAAFNAARTERDERSDALKNCREMTRAAQFDLSRAEFEHEAATKTLEERSKAHQRALETLGECAARLNELEQLESELQTLQNAPREWKALQKAQLDARDAMTRIELWRESLATLPTWSQAEREERHKRATLTRQSHEAAKAAEIEAQKRATEAQNKAQDARELAERASSKCQLANHEFEASRKHHEQAQQALAAASGQLTDKARELTVAGVEQECRSLSDADEEASRLREAQSRAGALLGRLQTLESQLESVPAAHREPVESAQSREEAAREAWNSSRKASEEARAARDELERRRRDLQTAREDVESAEHEERLTRKLADALSKKRLQAEIVQQAQTRLTDAANQTLGRLTGFEWKIELHEKAVEGAKEGSKDAAELEILARGPSGVPQPFENLSGGENFLVSVALAVAIGRTLAGAEKPPSTLIIDEGFGALDAVNRDHMVEELHRIAQELLGDGRVLVVSHQDDVRDRFNARYHLDRDETGAVRVTSFCE